MDCTVANPLQHVVIQTCMGTARDVKVASGDNDRGASLAGSVVVVGKVRVTDDVVIVTHHEVVFKFSSLSAHNEHNHVQRHPPQPCVLTGTKLFLQGCDMCSLSALAGSGAQTLRM